jgi:hypothetical protein
MIAFLAFLKQIRKRIGCKLTVFYKNDYFITQILPETVKLFTWILSHLCLSFTVGGGGGGGVTPSTQPIDDIPVYR